MKLFQPKTEDKPRFRLRDLQIGGATYTAPWAMWVRVDGECFIDVDYQGFCMSAYNCDLKVERSEKGFIAYIHESNYKWSRSDNFGFPDSDNTYAEVISFGEIKYENLSQSELNYYMEEAVKDDDFELAIKIRDFLYSKMWAKIQNETNE